MVEYSSLEDASGAIHTQVQSYAMQSNCVVSKQRSKVALFVWSTHILWIRSFLVLQHLHQAVLITAARQTSSDESALAHLTAQV